MIRKRLKKITAMILTLFMVFSSIVPLTVFAQTTLNVSIMGPALGDIIIDTNRVENNQLTTFDETKQTHAIKVYADYGKVFKKLVIEGNDVTPLSPTDMYSGNIAISGNTLNIEVEYDTNTDRPFSISWAYFAEEADKMFGDANAVVKNGDIKVTKVKLEDGTVLDYEKLTTFEDAGFGLEGKYEASFMSDETSGDARIPKGSEVTIQFVPKYGYQITSLSLNDTVRLTATDEVSTFTFIMPDTDLHLSAVFTKVDDVVKSSTNKVKSGTVKIGTNEINTGSTVLSVKEATLTDDQKATFNTKAGDYKVSNVFDIKLDQVIYKGTSDSYWSKPLGYSADLQTPAVITLKLDEGVDGNEVILIHEKEDGTYETIETTYDESTHTIFFSTSSFSNYAIASKTSANKELKDEIKNPQTYDGILNYIVLSMISLSGIIGIIAYRKKQNI